MKVTALIPDDLVRETQNLSNARTITEALIVALNAYVSMEKLKAMGKAVDKKPLLFRFTAEEIRELNRQL